MGVWFLVTQVFVIYSMLFEWFLYYLPYFMYVINCDGCVAQEYSALGQHGC